MEDIKRDYDDEIDLLDLFHTIWDEKWKIVAFVFVFLAGAFGFQLLQPSPAFIATTEIKPITNTQAERYAENNALGFFDITSVSLKDRFIEELENGSLFDLSIRRNNLIDREEFETDVGYDNAVNDLRNSITISANNEEENANTSVSILSIEYNNEDKWNSVLNEVFASANDVVQNKLKDSFATVSAIENQKREFQIEDLKQQISNLVEDYEIIVSNRLAFLTEQAEIARTLDISKNTIESQTFDSASGVLTNVQIDTPFYLKGFIAIEKEISLLESRVNKEAFIVGLLELQQKLRSIQQDQTLERAQALFSATPIITNDNFLAASVNVGATAFEYKNKRTLILALAVVLGGMIGVIYVLIASAVRKRKHKLING